MKLKYPCVIVWEHDRIPNSYAILSYDRLGIQRPSRSVTFKRAREALAHARQVAERKDLPVYHAVQRDEASTRWRTIVAPL